MQAQTVKACGEALKKLDEIKAAYKASAVAKRAVIDCIAVVKELKKELAKGEQPCG